VEGTDVGPSKNSELDLDSDSDSDLGAPFLTRFWGPVWVMRPGAPWAMKCPWAMRFRMVEELATRVEGEGDGDDELGLDRRLRLEVELEGLDMGDRVDMGGGMKRRRTGARRS